MIDRKWAINQIARFSGMHGFPSEAIAIKDRVDSLCWAESQDQAQQCIDEFIQNSSACPTAADIRASLRRASEPEFRPAWMNIVPREGKMASAGESMPEIPAAGQPSLYCERCLGKGVIVVKRRGTGAFIEQVYEEAAPCRNCAKRPTAA